MLKYITGEEQELWGCISDALLRYWKKLIGTEVSEETLCLLQEAFFKKRKEIVDEERQVVLGERHIAGAFLYGGSEGFLRLAKERMRSPEEKAETVAVALVQEATRLTEIRLESDAKAIFAGIFKKIILEKEVEFRSRIGEEVGIAY